MQVNYYDALNNFISPHIPSICPVQIHFLVPYPKGVSTPFEKENLGTPSPTVHYPASMLYYSTEVAIRNQG